jgi:hypothetical protein
MVLMSKTLFYHSFYSVSILAPFYPTYNPVSCGSDFKRLMKIQQIYFRPGVPNFYFSGTPLPLARWKKLTEALSQTNRPC